MCIVFTLFFPYPIETTHNLCISRFAKLVGWVAILWQRLCHIQIILHSDTTKHHIWHYKTVQVIRIVFTLFFFVSMKLPNCISYLMNSKSQPETCPNIKHELLYIGPGLGLGFFLYWIMVYKVFHNIFTRLLRLLGSFSHYSFLFLLELP